MRISHLAAVPGIGAYSNDDQAAIKAGAPRDGYHYLGPPITPGYGRIRQQSEAIQVLLFLDDGHVAIGGGVSVQYAGGSGREPLLDAGAAITRFLDRLNEVFAGVTADSFRACAATLRDLRLPRAVEYGVSQALLDAAAHGSGRTMAETIAVEYGTGVSIAPVPVFAQCGEDRRGAVDRMVLRQADALPHGLINNADLVGPDGQALAEYARFVRDRVLAHRADEGYEPVLHFDCYGTLGEVFGSEAECADYLARLADACDPFVVRVEQPVSAVSREAQIEALLRLRRRLSDCGSSVQLVADEWCNTLADVDAFLEAGAAHMLQVKLPDVGSLDDAVSSLLACRRAGVAGYCGGSCTETEVSARAAVHVAMGVGADVVLARPGMGVDEAVMVTRNEMARTVAVIQYRDAA
jgi:methylaspartate ammonia-lyase